MKQSTNYSVLSQQKVKEIKMSDYFSSKRILKKMGGTEQPSLQQSMNKTVLNLSDLSTENREQN
jgi:hypothetical protein